VTEARSGGLDRSSVVAGWLTFALIGAILSFYGPLIPVLEKRFDIGPSIAGSVLAAHFGGSLVGVLIAIRALRREGSGRFLALALGTLATGLVMFAVAPSWPVVLAASLVIGLGFGGLDLGVNQLFAHDTGPQGGSMLNVLNAFFGVGAIAGPVVVAATPPGQVGLVFVGCAMAAIALSLVLRHVHGSAGPDPGPGSVARSTVTPLAIAWLVAAFVLYVGVETGVGGWEPSHLLALGVPDAVARSSTAVFWLCLTAGRFLIAPLVGRLGPQLIVLACSVVAVATLGLAVVPDLAPYAYALTGLVIAPIYPTGLAWLAGAAPGVRTLTAYMVAASMAGGAVFPALTGLVIQVAGVTTTPVVLAVLASGCAASFVAFGRLLRGTAQASRMRAGPVPEELDGLDA
jgi:fucose permease